jgi:hydrogenase nickel incorporation protein HypB
MVKLVGSPGCGKSDIIRATIAQLSDSIRVGVVLANGATQSELARMRSVCPTVATSLRELKSSPELVLIEENASTVEIERDITLHVGVFSVAAGDNKAARDPSHLHGADLLLLTKVDLVPHVPFDLETFRADASRHSAARMLEISPHSGHGFELWLKWLRDLVQRRRDENAVNPMSPECFLG